MLCIGQGSNRKCADRQLDPEEELKRVLTSTWGSRSANQYTCLEEGLERLLTSKSWSMKDVDQLKGLPTSQGVPERGANQLV